MKIKGVAISCALFLEQQSNNNMNRIALDMFEIDIPREMRSYLRQNGYTFSKRAFEVAVKGMRRTNAATGKIERLDPWNKEQVEELLTKYGIKIDNPEGYGFVYAANMIRADYWKSSVKDEATLAQMVKDICDDIDLPGGNLFRKWCVDMDAKGEPIPWEDMI